MLLIVCALPCEARPLVKHFHLKQKLSYPIYVGDNISLIVSGIGNTSASCAVGYLQGLNNFYNSWLNIGVAGHRTHDIGTGFLIGKITDEITQRHYYPVHTFNRGFKIETLITKEEPEKKYTENSLYDMEGAGFFQAASKFSSAELIHCYKIVSDNLDNPCENINKKFVEGLIENNIFEIENIIFELIELSDQMQSIYENPTFEAYLENSHLTVSQKHKIIKLIKRYKTTGGSDIPKCKNGKELIKYLENVQYHLS